MCANWDVSCCHTPRRHARTTMIRILDLSGFVITLVAVGLFTAFMITLLWYQWRCPLAVAGAIGVPAGVLGLLTALFVSSVLSVSLWVTLGGVSVFTAGTLVGYNLSQSGPATP